MTNFKENRLCRIAQNLKIGTITKIHLLFFKICYIKYIILVHLKILFWSEHTENKNFLKDG